MINVGGFIGTIAEFIARDCAQRRLTLDFDKKGQACQAFTRLYYLLVDLEAITDHVREGARRAISTNSPDSMAITLRDSLRRVEISSNDYLETFSMLAEPLDIFAPEVARALGAVTNMKFNILWDVSKFVITKKDHHHYSEISKIKYLKPDDRLLEIDIAAYVKSVESGEAGCRASNFEWPEILLYKGDVTSCFKEVELDVLQIEDIRSFLELLDHHSVRLSSGKVAIRDYIKQTFTIEEVLFERKNIFPGWFM